MANLDVNNDELIKYTAKLEKLHRSAFPSAVRNTLNDAAFKHKQLIPKIAKQKFITRNPSFFKAFTTVNKAQGFNINTMVATSGINSSKGSRVADGVEKQEKGGTIRGRKLIAHNDARTSRSKAKRVSKRNLLNKVNFHDATPAFRAHRGTRKSKFVAAIMSTAKSGKTHMMLKTGSKGIVYQVTGISQNRNSKKVKFKIKKLYSVRNTKNTTVKGVNFMQISANLAQKKIPEFYKNNAEFQFKKFLK